MDEILKITVGVLISGFATHLITNYMHDKKDAQFADSIKELSQSFTNLALSLKEYVKQEIHREDIKDIYQRIKDISDFCLSCKNHTGGK